MAEGIDFSICKEDGKEEFNCNFCDTKCNSQKSIKTHITKTHVTIKQKVGKTLKKQATDEQITDVPLGSDLFDGFDFSKESPDEETANSGKTTDDIIKEYEDIENEGEELNDGKQTEILTNEVVSHMDAEQSTSPAELVDNESPASDEEKMKLLEQENLDFMTAQK